MKVHTRLKEIMDERGLKQADVARLCDIHPSLVNELYNAKRKSAAHKTLAKLSLGLGVDINEFITGKVSESEQEYVLFVRELEKEGVTREILLELLEVIKKIKPQ